jgi:hypothetical protein
MNSKFDELAKSLAGPSTRRQLLKKFSVGLAATALACFGLADRAKADKGGCKGSGSKCHNSSECCSGYCQFGFGKYKGNRQGTCL